MRKEPIYTTKAGHRRLQARLIEAHEAYLRVCDDNETAATSGETSVWHDSFDYEENQRQMHMLGREVHRIRDLLERVVVLERSDCPLRVEVGTLVELVLDGRSPQKWFIAGWDDGEPAQRRLAYNSPLGQAVLGAEVGEVREWVAGGNHREVEVVRIQAADEVHG